MRSPTLSLSLPDLPTAQAEVALRPGTAHALVYWLDYNLGPGEDGPWVSGGPAAHNAPTPAKQVSHLCSSLRPLLSAHIADFPHPAAKSQFPIAQPPASDSLDAPFPPVPVLGALDGLILCGTALHHRLPDVQLELQGVRLLRSAEHVDRPTSISTSASYTATSGELCIATGKRK